MAKAFLLAPLPMVSTGVSGTIVRGVGSNIGNDYAGVNCTAMCDLPGNVAAFFADLGADTYVDTVMLFGIGDLPADGTYTVAAATSAAPTSYFIIGSGTAYAGSQSRTDAAGVLLALLTAPGAYRYISVGLIAATTGKMATVSRIVVGRRFQPAINFEYGAQFGVRDLGSLDVSRRGVLLRNRGKKLRTVSLNFPSLTKQEAEGTAQKLMERVGNTECVALCTDPTPDPERQNRCYFGPLVGDLGRTWRTAVGHEARVNLLGIL